MQQHQLEQAIARATGESIHTIRERGFGLVERRTRRGQRSGPRDKPARMPSDLPNSTAVIPSEA